MTTKEAVKQLYKAKEAIEVLLAAYEKREPGSTKKAPTRTVKRFCPPSLSEWIAYGNEQDPPYERMDAESAWNHYEASGWFVGKKKMVDWKAALRTCHTRWARDKNVTRKQMGVANMKEAKEKLARVQKEITSIRSKIPEHGAPNEHLSDEELERLWNLTEMERKLKEAI